jgi:hypothetical protein
MLLLLKAKQIQAGAEWDSVIGVTVAILLIAGIAFLLLLFISRGSKRRQFKRGSGRLRRKQK